MPCGAANIVTSAPGPDRANSAWRRRVNRGANDTQVRFKGQQQTGAALSTHNLRRGATQQPQRACFSAVTSISIFMRGSARPAEIIMAAGLTAPKYFFRTGQHLGNSLPSGST